MLPSRIVHILNFFDVCGYCTGSSALAEHKKLQLIIFAIHLASVLVLTFYQFQTFTDLYPAIGFLETLNEMVQYSIELYTYCLILWDSFLYRKQHIRFWRAFQKINAHLKTNDPFYNGYVCKFIEYFLVTNILYVSIFLVEGFPLMSPVFIFLVLILVCQLRVFYYLFCVEAINSQLNVIEHIATGKAVSQIKCINEYYDCVTEMFELLSDIFGFSQVAVVLFCFYFLLTDLNWLYACYDRFSPVQICGRYFISFREFELIVAKMVYNGIVSVAAAWIAHSQLVIIYLFRSTYNCSNTVCFQMSSVNQ